MYLSKNRNATYYSRICFPLHLQNSHAFPKEIRFSLNTKSRQEATERNLAVAAFIKKALKTVTATCNVKAFITKLKAQLATLRTAHFTFDSEFLFYSVPKAPVPLVLPVVSSVDSVDTPVVQESNQSLLERFLKKKESEKITIRSLKQLETRISHFLSYLSTNVSALTTKLASDYRDHLMTTNRSIKSKKEYLSAIKQFVNWLVLNEIVEKNYFSLLKIKLDTTRSAAEERSKWSEIELKKLFKHDNFTKPIGQNSTLSYQKKLEDFWIPLILLHTGARTGEICQLRTQDIIQKEGVWCFDINDEGESRSIKTAAARRLIPIHSALIELGFLEYVNQRQQANQVNLFSITPIGVEQSWSAQFATRFAKVLKDIGLTHKGRPSLHSLRHTVINKAQAVGLHENEIASLVGHSKGITYGRYGKELDINRLNYVINKLDFKSVCSGVICVRC